MSIADNIKSSFKKGSSLIKLIYINAAVFLVLSVTIIIGFLLRNQGIPETTVDFLSVPASLHLLALRPWTLLTYMFTHKDIWHILFNMLWLYWFGTIFLEYLDQRKLVSVYLLGGLSGAVVYIASFNIFPAFTEVINESAAIGASASVMAIVIAIAAYVPDYTVGLFLFGRIKIKYLALAIFVMTTVMDFSVNSGGKLAHMGGALFGYLYTVNIKRGHDPGKWINSVIDFFVTLFKPRKKMKVTYRKSADEYEYNRIKTENQERINRILDKISKGGYDSLTKEEKDILFKESQKKN
jgi:membrane associated rhomboid family serine protease